MKIESFRRNCSYLKNNDEKKNLIEGMFEINWKNFFKFWDCI